MIQITPAYDAGKTGYLCRHLKRLKQTTHIQGNIHCAKTMFVRDNGKSCQQRKKYLFRSTGCSFKNSRFQAKRVGLFFGYYKGRLVKLDLEQIDGLIVSV